MTNEFAGSGNGELLKSLVNVSDAINEQIFNANQTIDGSFINRQAIIADIDPIENLKLQMEEREQEDEDKSVFQEAEEALTQLREEQERERIQAWENAQSSEYPGLTNKEVLAGLRKICGNLPYYSDMAVKNGWIAAKDKAKFEEYLTDELWLKEQERIGHTNSPDYTARKAKHEHDARKNPNLPESTKNMVNATKGMGINVSATNTQGLTANLNTGDDRIEKRVDITNIDADAGKNNPVFKDAAKNILNLSIEQNLTKNVHPLTVTNDADRGIATGSEKLENDVVSDGALKISGPSLTKEFNKKAPNETAFEPIKMTDANNMVQSPQVKPAQFSQSNGMI